MPPDGHKRLANLLIGSIFAAALYFTLRGEAVWPFAPYDMYSSTSRPYITQYYLEGESVGGRRFPLTTGYLYPFNNRELLFKIFPPLLGRPEQLDQRLQLFKRHYEERRRAGKHRGPELRTIRLYRITWALEEGARNLHHPDRKTLLRELQ